MDSKKKTRPQEPQRRSRSEKEAKRVPAKRPVSAPRKREQPAAQSRTNRRPQEAPRRPREPVEQPRRQQEVVAAENTPEMVFKMDGKQAPKQRIPQDPAAAKRAQQRIRSAKRSEERKKQAARRSRAPKVVYTQPRPINVSRLMLQLAIVMAMVLAISLGVSVFFKVEKVMVYGNNAYSAQTVQEAAGIEGGENLMSFGNIRACGKIKAGLPYVDTVRIGIKLPDTVNIYITEYDVVYSIRSQNGTWWLMTSDGRVVEQTDYGTATGYTQVLGVELDNPTVGEQGIAYEASLYETQAPTAAPSTEATGFTEEPPVTVTAAERLNAALTILESLELNDLVGVAASVDVSSINSIELWYGTQYQVRLGGIGSGETVSMDTKLEAMKKAVAQLSDYQTGILDVSFTTWQDEVGYTPFE